MFHLLEHIDWNQIGGLLTAVAIIFAGLRRLWRAIKNMEVERDKKRLVQFSAIKASMQAVFDAHEALDQRRHEENIERFAEINATLARNGINGGTPRRAHKR